MAPITPNSSAMEALSKKIGAECHVFDEYCRTTGYPMPSLERTTPSFSLPHEAPTEVHVARERIMSYALNLFQLAAGPSEYLANLQTGYHYVACLQWLLRFKIFALVPQQEQISYSDPAELAQVDEGRLKSVARMAITSGLFVESSPLYIAHSATSALISTNPNFRDWAMVLCSMSAPTAAAMTEAHARWPNAKGQTQAAYNIAFGHDIDFFKHLSQSPVLHKQFAGYMRSVTASRGTHMDHLLDGFDWEKLGSGVVVDVGGSTGQASIALAREFPQLNFIVQDRTEVASGGDAYIESLQDPRLAGRITYQAHDFFLPQHVMGADVYLLRMILHDWAFDDSIKILKNIVAAMGKSSRVLIMDTVLPDPGKALVAKERLLRVRDMAMMQTFNSQERSLDDWLAILERVDPRLDIRNIVQPHGSVMSVMEVVFEQD